MLKYIISGVDFWASLTLKYLRATTVAASTFRPTGVLAEAFTIKFQQEERREEHWDFPLQVANQEPVVSLHAWN